MEQRKNQHLQFALQFHQEENPDWDRVFLPITSFPEAALSEIDISTQIMGLDLACPFFINAMTGGSLKAEKLNRQLAILARECRLMLATGSYSIALKEPAAKRSFAVIREEAPDIIVGVNLGADKTADLAVRAVEEMGADFLQIHVNPLQEMIMPEGERNFRGWIANIQAIRERVEVPVMVKQVGFGMSAADIEKLMATGITTIDISGGGGTNFAQIENARREKGWQYLQTLDISTVDSLQNSRFYQSKAEIIASGGIKNPLHIAKALAMGAKAVGIAGQILFLLEKEGLNRTMAIVREWQEELKLLYLACGAKSTTEMNGIDTKIMEKYRK
ncbi:type 2 isopentenyl-diphosphate Delta-isomerase [Clostridiales bacterium COT073_COT-073]|nr:type 2 isopentenyl-diphosphate Delta-isomerase [Clostridiales bacterium COT073_COT-073]